MLYHTLPQGIDNTRPVIGAKDGRGSNDDVGTGLSGGIDRRGGQTTVDLNIKIRTALPQCLHLGHLISHELLAREARFDSHNKDHIQIIDEFVQRIDRRSRLHRHTDLHASILDGLDQRLVSAPPAFRSRNES